MNPMKRIKKLIFQNISLIIILFLCSCKIKKNIPENMIYITKGEFMMGSKYSPDEIQENYGYEFTETMKDNWQVERPYHKVIIEKGYYISKYEVTVGEFEAFVNETGYITDAEKGIGSYGYTENGEWSKLDGLSWRKPGLWKVELNQPVVLVSWNDATEYVKWLSKKTNNTFRLPTEQEWEFACRAGKETNFTWGDLPKDGMGKINALDSYFGFDDGFKYVAPVGSFKPNDNNIYDMLGNVWEWCSSQYVKDYPIDVNEPLSDEYVDRGGGWDSPPYNARISNRGAAGSGFNSCNLGFRLVMEKH